MFCDNNSENAINVTDIINKEITTSISENALGPIVVNPWFELGRISNRMD